MSAVEAAEARGASVEELRELLGKGRAKKGIFEGDLEAGELEIGQKGIFEGDLEAGELEIGQVASLFHEQQTAKEIIDEMMLEFIK